MPPNDGLLGTLQQIGAAAAYGATMVSADYLHPDNYQKNVCMMSQTVLLP